MRRTLKIRAQTSLDVFPRNAAARSLIVSREPLLELLHLRPEWHLVVVQTIPKPLYLYQIETLAWRQPIDVVCSDLMRLR